MAEELCLEALSQGDLSADLLGTLSSVYDGMGQGDDSLAAALAACLVGGRKPDQLCDLSRLCESRGLLGEAEACLQDALDQAPEHKRARRQLRRLLEKVPGQASRPALRRAYLMRASRHLASGEAALALSVAAALESLDPDAGAADLVRGAVYERLGHYRDAAECYAAAERFDPERARAARRRASDKDRRDRRGRAEPIVRQIQQHLAAGEDDIAARLATKLVGLVPWAPAPYLLWARAAEAQGHTENAIRNLREALARATTGQRRIAAKIMELRGMEPTATRPREEQAS
ncbi:MAG: hypothetical protein GF320_18885 [Armatimonadia bacterium]|nr:hypothetical protein [Armatimonadia bacterium]